jgi:branched-chain amino acid transport system permease protein
MADLSLTLWLQAVVNGFTLGWLYTLMALGLTFIMSMSGILQLAHGEIYMIGAYIVYYLSVSVGLDVYLALPLSMILMAALGVVLEKYLFRHVQGKLLEPIVISSGLTLILTSLALVSFGLYGRSIPRLANGGLAILGATVPRDRAMVIVITLIFLIATNVFLKKSRFGQAMIAMAQNREGGLMRGINPVQISRLAFIIACSLAAAAGSLTGAIVEINPYMGTPALVKGIVIIVLGGLGSISGAVIAGLIIGFLDGILPIVATPMVTAIAPLLIVIAILLIKPQGLFGHE